MADYLFVYHGGGVPETPEEQASTMAAWNNWYGAIGENLSHGGAPVGMSSTVSSSGVASDGGANPVSGLGPAARIAPRAGLPAPDFREARRVHRPAGAGPVVGRW